MPTLKVVRTLPVDIALRTLSMEELRKVQAWLHQLERWDTDAHVRKMSKPIAVKDTYILTTSDDTYIFFKKEAGTITVLDIAKKATIDQFADVE